MDARCIVLIGLALWIGVFSCYGQKDVFIPNEWDDDPALQEWSWDRSYESENFAAFWGPEVGTDSEMRFPDADPPARVVLEANFPNPFSNATSIPFALPSEMEVSMAVYDLLGRRIETIIERKSLPAGHHTSTWTPKSVASGTYVVQLEASNRSLIEKVTILN